MHQAALKKLQRTGLLLVERESLPVALLELLELLVDRKLLLRRETFPLSLDVGKRNGGRRGGGGRCGGVRGRRGRRDGAADDVCVGESDSGTRQAECLHGVGGQRQGGGGAKGDMSRRECPQSHRLGAPGDARDKRQFRLDHSSQSGATSSSPTIRRSLDFGSPPSGGGGANLRYRGM